MPTRAYQASGDSNPGATLQLAVACLGAALIGGVVEGVVSNWLSLVLLFPALLGGIVSFAAVRVIERSHVRAPWVAAIIAGLAGLTAQLVVSGVQYAWFRADVRARIEQPEQSEPTPRLAGMMDSSVDDVLEQISGGRGFVGYLKFRAKIGTEIKKAGQSSGLKLKDTGFWILFGINFLIAGGIAAGAAAERARAPYCEPCKRWYSQTERVAVGSSDKSAVKKTLQVLDSGSFTELPEAIGSPRSDAIALLGLLRCESCKDHEPQLSVTVITGIGKKQQSKSALKTMLRPDEARSIVAAFTTAAEKAAAKSGTPT